MLAAKRHDKDVKGRSFPKEREAAAEAEGQQLPLSLLVRTADQMGCISLFVESIPRSNAEVLRSGLAHRLKDG